MPSLSARFVNFFVRLIVRRKDWGDETSLAHRARRLFGAPEVYGRVVLKGLKHEPVNIPGNVRGEWIMRSDSSSDILLYIHGGGYVSCSSITHRPITVALARRVGCRVFSADYALAPESKFPAALDDVIRVYEWLLTKNVSIAVAGDSAGGGLALALAVYARDAGLELPACVVLFSPWTDLAGTGGSAQSNDGKCDMLRRENLDDFASAYLGDHSREDPRASPIYADPGGLPPILFQVGSTEILLDDSRRVHEKILAAHGSSRLTVYNGVSHGWQMLTPFVPEARQSLDEAADFITGNLSG